MTIFEDLAPAKVNLTLDVVGRRTDGYHALRSLVAFAQTAADLVVLDVSRPVGSAVTGPFAATLSGKNLIDVTLAKLAAADPDLQLGHVTLTKNLPVAAGIGGGSADAAAVLRAVRRANHERSQSVNWHALAVSLGADVPVCLAAHVAWMTGIGDVVTPLTGVPALAAVLVNPLSPMPDDKTAQVFRALATSPAAADASVAPPPPFATRNDLLAYMRAHGNGLEAAACRVAPIIADVKRALIATHGCHYAAVSGGGPTCFAIFDDPDTAAAIIQWRHPDWWVQAVTLR